MLFRSEEEAARKLHSERGSALLLVAGKEILDSGRGQAREVDAVVLEEAAVLDAQHRLNQIRRNLVIGEQAALGAVGALAQPGDQQRLQLIAGQRLPMRVGDRLAPLRRRPGWWPGPAHDRTEDRAAR